MRFIQRGPDVPERLLQAHEDGNVVFFCGAGLSYPAGLPGFAKLTQDLHAQMKVDTPQHEHYDVAIRQLEEHHIEGRLGVRRKLADIILDADTSRNGTRSHEALLTLSQTHDRKSRLVTTNFDRCFEVAANTLGLAPERYSAPYLPIPKRTRWDGIVYLHGLLPESPSDEDLDRLVVSSGDFGLAYLAERWAARFVTDLFRDYTVCFVGYSLNDPVLRYMLDAIAADHQRGESRQEVFAFASATPAQFDDTAREWQAKNVIPILYKHTNAHAYLHRTLKTWAATYNKGIRAKEQIAISDAMASPKTTTKEDDFIDRVLWAITDRSGLPAKAFADAYPAPSLDWLDPLMESRYGHDDLNRFGVTPHETRDAKLSFSVIDRPSPYEKAPRMALFKPDILEGSWDEVMYQLSRWLLRHLDNPELVLRIARHGGRIDGRFSQMLSQNLADIEKLEAERKWNELEQIRDHSPYAIPRSSLRTIWRLIQLGRVGGISRDMELYQWSRLASYIGLTSDMRVQLRALLSPRIELRSPIHWPEGFSEPDEQNTPRNIVDWDLKLSSDHPHTHLENILGPEPPNWLADILGDITSLLHDVCELMRDLGAIDATSDHSFVHQPSISPHEQNKRFEDWTVLIDLAREAWRLESIRSPEHAYAEAERWHWLPFPVFKRLSLYAGSHYDALGIDTPVRWLLADNSWWLWSTETQREALRLLVSLAPHWSRTQLDQLESAILAGPPVIPPKNSGA